MKEHKPGDLFNKFHKKKKELWIAGAIKKPGALHKELGIKEGKKICGQDTKVSPQRKGGKEGAPGTISRNPKVFPSQEKENG